MKEHMKKHEQHHSKHDGKAMHHHTELDKTGSMERKSLTNSGNDAYKVGHGGSLSHYLKTKGSMGSGY